MDVVVAAAAAAAAAGRDGNVNVGRIHARVVEVAELVDHFVDDLLGRRWTIVAACCCCCDHVRSDDVGGRGGGQWRIEIARVRL